jgi:anti-anti-sigma factor
MHDELRIHLDRLDRVTVSLARAEIYRAIDRADGDVHLDLGDMEWVDRIGLALLAAAHERSHRRGHHLVVHCNSPALRRTLAVTRLARVLHLAPV